MSDQRHEQEVQNIEQLKSDYTEDAFEIEGDDEQTASAPATPSKYDLAVQTSFLAHESPKLPTEEEQEEEEVDLGFVELSDMEEVFEEEEFSFQPYEGDKLEFHHERRIYKAEMSSNNRDHV